ncbi:response regulator [Vulgatibacter incomptus]|uniref:Two component, sigma54 specific, transcriptional regulator, Fis family n=1 Tax=Vulgatibacter incomptus TaxID=1391653 RepID=A0A0K1PBC7_9BACT|nr:response regulator [Vulgatibacter incomptus]AKU90843.1 two component, sigma54 specific, transcriptional regulator, Fis family [Vulgatibacter incomptus]
MDLLRKMQVARIRRSIEERRRRILLVDDDRLYLTMLADLLCAEGWDVTGVGSAEAVLERSDLTHFDLAMVDVVLPKLDGISLVQRLRETPSGAALPIVLMSSSSPEQMSRSAFDLGCAGFVTKPIDDRIVIETLHRLLD